MKNWFGKVLAAIVTVVISMFLFWKPRVKQLRPGGIRTILGDIYPAR